MKSTAAVLGSGLGLALLLAHPVQAETTATITAVTDYDFRGVSQSEGDPALQGSLDWAGEQLYAGLWFSTIDQKGKQTFGNGTTGQLNYDGNLEIDLSLGLAHEYTSGWRTDVGVVYYVYPGSEAGVNDLADDFDDEAEIEDYGEAYVGGGWGPFDLKYWYSWDLYNSDETASYVELNASFPLPHLPAGLTLNLHAGHSFGDYFDALEDAALADDPGNYTGSSASYSDYAVGLGATLGAFDVEARYVLTGAEGNYWDVERGVFENDGRFVLSVSTTFPRSKGEE
jgi:uncharacterized protein (TIGR02001 family)